MKLFAKIRILRNKKNICYQIEITDSEYKTLTFTAYSLEDAISFIEEVAAKCRSNKDVVVEYNKQINQYMLGKPNENVIFLSENEVLDAIVNYNKNNSEDNVVSVKNLYVEDGKLDLCFFLYEGNRVSKLRDEHLIDAFNHYLDDTDFELEDFRVVGGVRNEGDKEVPYFDGIDLIVKAKEKVKGLGLRKE